MSDDRWDEVRAALGDPEDIDMDGVETPHPCGDDGPPNGEPPSADAEERLTPSERAAREPLNDLGNARRFRIYHGEDVLHVPRVGWHAWDGRRWAKDPDGLVVRRLAQGISARITEEIPHIALERWEDEAIAAIPSAEQEIKRLRAEEESEDRAEALRKAEATLETGIRAKTRLSKLKSEMRGFAKTTGNSDRITKLLKEAEVLLSCPLETMDADPLAVNCLNGTLRFTVERGVEDEGMSPVASVTLTPHDKADRFTKLMQVEYDPQASSSLFGRFLTRVQPDSVIRRFLQRTFGLAMTALPMQRIWFFYGHGANGKSVLVDAMADLMGDYASSAKIESLTGQSKRGGSDATPDLIPLMGARMVRASEPEQGERLKEGTIKELTGGEPILVRALHSDFVEVRPVFKLILSGNHKPEIRGTDDGIWRRVLLVPFDVQIPEAERDQDLGRKLKAERSGMLNWLIDGLIDFLERGLQVPDTVSDATQSYREESDPLGNFLADGCEVTGDVGHWTATKDLVAAFNIWAEANGTTQWKPRTIENGLKDRAGRWRPPGGGSSFEYSKVSVSGYRGIRLTTDMRDQLARLRGGAASPPPDPDPDF
ncbi:phage/plasmid primase, P4 family [Pseudoroseicyclus sp. CXY001]|uniref:phage/plasmid primase, P4 family n=1 Tax=Pseudoroseicyclus sp. CXY001 TaxID=3242492 RepID=UPI003571242C